VGTFVLEDTDQERGEPVFHNCTFKRTSIIGVTALLVDLVDAELHRRGA